MACIDTEKGSSALNLPLTGETDYEEGHHARLNVTGTRLYALVSRVSGSWLIKLGFLSVWLCLTIGGMLSLRPFMKSLDSNVPPVKGTRAHSSEQAMGKYYYSPRHDDSNTKTVALLISGKDGAPMVGECEESANRSAVLKSANYEWVNMTTQSADLNLNLNHNFSKPIDIHLANKTDIYDIVCDRCPDSCSSDPIKISAPLGPLGPPGVEVTIRIFMPPFTNSALVLKMVNATMNAVAMLKQMGPGLAPVAAQIEEQSKELFAVYRRFKPQLLDTSCDVSLTAITLVNCPKSDQLDIATDLQDMYVPPGLKIQVSSLELISQSIQEGVAQTMDVSTMTLPIALLFLAAMINNLRLVLCTFVNLAAAAAAAILFMFPIAKSTAVPTVAPSMMIAVALAMSIDYSLFLLSRFQDEMAGRDATVEKALTASLLTSGRIVLVSGGTLLLCFCTMLVLPVQIISMMGVSAAITVFFTILSALTLTPALLLTFPNFFSANYRCGLSLQGCSCCCCFERGRLEKSTPSFERSSAVAKVQRSRWVAVGNATQTYALPIVLAMLASACAIGGAYLPKFDYALGLKPMMPSGTSAMSALESMSHDFGATTVFPLNILVVPEVPVHEADLGLWYGEVCELLRHLAQDTMGTEHFIFTGSMLVGDPTHNSSCLFNRTTGVLVDPQDLRAAQMLSATHSAGEGKMGTPDRSVVSEKVAVSTNLDLFSEDGQQWIKSMREAMDERGPAMNVRMYMTGDGCSQLDNAEKAFGSLGLMVGLMMAVVVLLLAVTFRSVIAPLRAVICLAWMLAITFGFAIAVYQSGVLDWLQWDSVHKRKSGAMYWMSLLITLPIVVGLGLDYDIFYSERVAEERRKGISDSQAAVNALVFTANTISAAGVIMVLAFSALLISHTPCLNEISFLLIVGILCDCFVSTKFIIPAFIALLDGFNFWPSIPRATGVPKGWQFLSRCSKCCSDCRNGDESM